MTDADTSVVGDQVLEALVVRPGDTLIVRVGERISEDYAQHLKAELTKRLPGVEAVVMAGVDQLAVYRPEG